MPSQSQSLRLTTITSDTVIKTTIPEILRTSISNDLSIGQWPSSLFMLPTAVVTDAPMASVISIPFCITITIVAISFCAIQVTDIITNTLHVISTIITIPLVTILTIIPIPLTIGHTTGLTIGIGIVWLHEHLSLCPYRTGYHFVPTCNPNDGVGNTPVQEAAHQSKGIVPEYVTREYRKCSSVDVTSPSGFSDTAQNSNPVTVHGDWPVGSISPFVRQYRYDSLVSSSSASANIAMPTKASAGPSGHRSTDIGVRRPVEETAQDGTDSREDLNDTRASRITSVGHFTAPPPYSQIGEREV
ncbi:hypothetical protein V8D89_004153 [Ganoderma adspersum]